MQGQRQKKASQKDAFMIARLKGKVLGFGWGGFFFWFFKGSVQIKCIYTEI